MEPWGASESLYEVKIWFSVGFTECSVVIKLSRVT